MPAGEIAIFSEVPFDITLIDLLYFHLSNAMADGSLHPRYSINYYLFTQITGSYLILMANCNSGFPRWPPVLFFSVKITAGLPNPGSGVGPALLFLSFSHFSKNFNLRSLCFHCCFPHGCLHFTGKAN